MTENRRDSFSNCLTMVESGGSLGFNIFQLNNYLSECTRETHALALVDFSAFDAD